MFYRRNDPVVEQAQRPRPTFVPAMTSLRITGVSSDAGKPLVAGWCSSAVRVGGADMPL